MVYSGGCVGSGSDGCVYQWIMCWAVSGRVLLKVVEYDDGGGQQLWETRMQRRCEGLLGTSTSTLTPQKNLEKIRKKITKSIKITKTTIIAVYEWVKSVEFQGSNDSHKQFCRSLHLPKTILDTSLAVVTVGWW